MTPAKVAFMVAQRYKNRASYEDIREQCKGDDGNSRASDAGIQYKKLGIRPPPSHADKRHTLRPVGGR